MGKALSRSPSEYEEAGLPVPEVFERREISKSMIPVRRAKAESVTYFARNFLEFKKKKNEPINSDYFFLAVVPEHMGILRASVHQSDGRFTTLKGTQSLGNAFAALAMLRLHKSREWIKRILDDVLKMGDAIYRDSVRQRRAGEKLRVSTMCPKITIEERDFEPAVDEYTVVGRLQSTNDGVLDLLPALGEFFRNNDTCVITGPLTLAVWLEDGLFYMFDPNERDKNGLVVIKSVQFGSELRILDYIPGVACVTWYKDLRHLVEVYMKNVDKDYRREPFIISKVLINDYFFVPEPWNHFQGALYEEIAILVIQWNLDKSNRKGDAKKFVL